MLHSTGPSCHHYQSISQNHSWRPPAGQTTGSSFPGVQLSLKVHSFAASRGLHASEGLEAAWQALAGLFGSDGEPQGTPRSGLEGVHELKPGQSLATPNSGTSVDVDPNGTMAIGAPGVQTRNHNACHCSGEYPLASLSEMFSQMASNGVVNQGAPPSAEELGFKIEKGNIVLPDGRKIPFGNRGVIIRLPDGMQVGVGRNSQTSDQHVRWVVAGPGEEIPTNPPGKTNIYQLGQDGQLQQAGVK